MLKYYCWDSFAPTEIETLRRLNEIMEQNTLVERWAEFCEAEKGRSANRFRVWLEGNHPDDLQEKEKQELLSW